MLERSYGLLLHLYPPAFRRRFGWQMQADFRDLLLHGSSPFTAFWDIVVTAPREWWGVVRQGSVGRARRRSVVHAVDSVRMEVGRALRTLLRRPAFTAVVVTTLAIGIGASTAVFSWTEGVVLRPLPAVRAPSELFSLDVRDPGASDQGSGLSYPDLLELDAAVTPGHLAGFAFGQFRIPAESEGVAAGAEQVWGAFVTGDYFTTLGLEPLAGRLLRSGDGSGREGDRLAVISEALWTRRFGRDPGAVGASLKISGDNWRVVGVAPAGFMGTIVGLELDVWVPIEAAPVAWNEPRLLEDRGRRWIRVFGRGEPGTAGSIRAQLLTEWQRLSDSQAGGHDLRVAVVPLDIGIAARLKPLFIILLGITGLVLLAVCTNVANLLLLKGTMDEREVAVRIALGATRGRVASRVLAEAAILGGLGLAGGLAIARYTGRIFPSLLPASSLPLAIEAPMDARVFAFSAIVGAATVLLFGMAPALRASRAHPGPALRSRRGAMPGSVLQTSALIVVQLAVSLATLVSAGFFLHRLDQLARIDRGFVAPDKVLLFPTYLPAADLEAAWRDEGFGRLVEAVRRLPPVEAATISTFVPLGFENYASLEVDVPGERRPNEGVPRYLVNRVGEGYFALMGIPIEKGRPLDARDDSGAPVAVIINESFRRTHWPDVDPLGRGLTVGGREAIVVGVVGDGKYRFDEIDEPSPPFLYLAWRQWAPSSPILHVRVRGPRRGIETAVRQAFSDRFPNGLLQGPMSLEKYTSVALVPVRLGVAVLTGLGVLAMSLAALGLYAIMAFQVSQRTREVGIRAALGAGRSQIVGMFLREGGRTAVTGLVGGLPIALAVHKAFEASISRFEGGGIAVYGAAAGVLLFVALLAVGLAASKAARIEVSSALRVE